MWSYGTRTLSGKAYMDGPVVLLGWSFLISGESCDVGRYSDDGASVINV